MVGNILRTNASLRYLDISCNMLGADACNLLLEGMQSNKSVLHMRIINEQCSECDDPPFGGKSDDEIRLMRLALNSLDECFRCNMTTMMEKGLSYELTSTNVRDPFCAQKAFTPPHAATRFNRKHRFPSNGPRWRERTVRLWSCANSRMSYTMPANLEQCTGSRMLSMRF